MERSGDLESKYQTLAAEYSKVRSQATVLKGAVLDEQTKNLELRELMKEQDLKIRKHAQEMDSLTFRNDQLTKRISVLQQELQGNSHGKKGKNKVPENCAPSSLSVLDEELHKKILENAQLVSTMADRDLLINDYKEQIEWLEEKVKNLEETVKTLKDANKAALAIKNGKPAESIQTLTVKDCSKYVNNENEQLVNRWKQDAERWRTECELLRSKPQSNEQLCDYYETQIRSILETKQLAESEVKSLWAENSAINARLEALVLENNKLESSLERCNEELLLVSKNYKSQLDAMTEHFAAQNEKITKQCDEIEVLKHKLFAKKP